MEKLADVLSKLSLEQTKGVFYNGTRKSYLEIYQVSIEMKERILEFGKNKLVGLFLPNSIMFIEAFFAVQFADRIPVLIPTIERKDALEKMVIDTKIDLIITNSAYKKIILEAIEQVKQNVFVYNIDTDKITLIRGNIISDKSFQNELKGVAVVIKTSGTIDMPKYVMLTHEGLLGNLKAHINSIKFSKSENTLIVLPMCFGYCLSSQMLAHIYMNANIYIAHPTFDCIQFVNDIYLYKITNTTTVSSVISLLARYIRSRTINIEKLRHLDFLIFGGMQVAIEDIETIQKALPSTQLIQTYGQTEHSPRITTMIYKEKIINSVGKAIENVQVKIDETNEVLVKSPYIMKGYLGNSELTNEAINEGWLHTGDLGYLDNEGYLYLNGRKKNIIIRNGINISPEEIEMVIRRIEGVLDVIVVGERAAIVGENIIAKVVVKEGAVWEIIKKQIQDLCKQTLSPYKYPYRIEFCKEIEKTYNGKVKRNGANKKN